MFTAMNRIRVHLLDIVRQRLVDDLAALQGASTALHQILDLELAIMLETYREDLVVKNRSAERLATIGQFAAGIGHELRNPLGVIESSLFLLAPAPGTRTPLPAPKSPSTSIESVARSFAPTRPFKISSTWPAIDRRAGFPPSFASWSRARPQLALLPPMVRVTVAAVPDDLAIHVDPDQIEQVLVNLFMNSAQAMPQGGRIQVAGGGRCLPRRRPAIRVHDDGPGDPGGGPPRIFEALFTTKAKGSGLGLALCRRIVEAHGGSIQLAPSDAGAAFVLVLPTAPITANMTA